MRGTFAAFILSHGRAGNIKTIKSLKRGGYTGDVYIIIDNEDNTAEEYRRLYGDKVIMFDKLAMSKRFDTADTSQDRRAIVYARNACFDIAQDLGIDYFLQLDDDYTSFVYRYLEDGKLKARNCRQLDRLFSAMVDWLEDTGAYTVALAQSGDFIGGAKGRRFHEKVLRKAMNTFFCKTDRRFTFLGRVNEDVNTYTRLGSTGGLFLSITDASINQGITQVNKGGMSEMYLDSGTYVKSFYTVLFMPSCVKVGQMGTKHQRLHHVIEWRNCVPCILHEKHKRKVASKGG